MRLHPFGRGSGTRAGLLAASTFVGIGAGAAPAAEAADPQAAPAAEDDEMKDREPKPKPEKAKTPAKDPDQPANPDDDDDETDKDREEDEDEEGELKGKGKSGAARLRERARCAAIFAHPSAAANIDFAAELAFNTSLPRHQACALLDKAPKATIATGSGLTARMNSLATGPGAGDPTTTQKQKADASWGEVLGRVAVTSRK